MVPLPTLRIALAQLNATVGDLSGNTEKIVATMKSAKDRSVDLIAFPEMSISGYPPEDLLHKAQFIEENRRALTRVIRESAGLTVVVGCIEQEQNRLYNAAALIHQGRQVLSYHKCHLPNYGVFDENRYFSPGLTAPVFQLNGVTLGINICEDIWSQDGPIQAQVASGAQLIININASPFQVEKGKLREDLLRKRARENGTSIAYVNMVGGQDELVFDGGSLAFNQQGSLLARAEHFEETLMVFDLRVDQSVDQKLGKDRPAIEGLKPSTSKVNLIQLESHQEIKNRPPCLPVISKKRSDDEEIYDALKLGLADYVSKNRFEKGVIGLSGGIDSALTAALAVDALGKENVIGVFMPSCYTSNESREDAIQLAKNLDIQLLTFPIAAPFESFLSLLSSAFAGSASDQTEENLQARIRGNLMMALSNKFNWLVLTTGNKSEMSVGYATLYGDMAGGFAVIKDLWKTAVYRLSRLRNRCPDTPIPQRIIEKAPSAELRPNQKDQDSLPPYEILDPILQAYVEEDRPFEEIVALGFDPATVSSSIALVDSSEFKRRQAPIGIKITDRALGKDHRMPMTNRYRSFHRYDLETKNKSETTTRRRKTG